MVSDFLALFKPAVPAGYLLYLLDVTGSRILIEVHDLTAHLEFQLLAVKPFEGLRTRGSGHRPARPVILEMGLSKCPELAW